MKVTDEHREWAGLLADPVSGEDGPIAVEGYLEAVERIEYHDEDPSNVFWVAPHDEAQVVPGYGLMYGPDGEALSSEEGRQYAYELLVLADLNDATSRANPDREEAADAG